MRKKILLGLCALFMLGITTFAQTIATGKVVDEKGAAISGATVIEKGTKNGTTTASDGSYSLKVKSGARLVVSSVGYEGNTIAAASGGKVQLKASSIDIEEVVVTALGIKRSDKALGYSAQNVKGDVLIKSNAGDILNGLSGQAAGVNIIKSAGGAGAPTFVQIRGQNTLTGDVQPLIVIDGIIIDNSSFDSNGDGTAVSQGGQGYSTANVQNSNRGIDINPDDIESVTILKGGAAAALYGLRAANGVIVYTTKKGTKGKGLSVSYTSSLTMNRVSQLPEMQNKYLQGQGGKMYGPEVSTSRGRSWGPLGDTMSWNGDNTYKYDSHGKLVSSNDPSAKTKFSPYDNLNTFFDKATSYYNSVSLSGGNDVASFRTSLSNVSETGIIPTNTFSRTTASIGGQFKFEKSVLEGSLTFSNSNNNAVQEGSNTAGVFLGLYRTPISFDLLNGQTDKSNNKSYEFADGSQRTFRPNVYDNPYWSVNKNPFNSNTNRFFGNLQYSYKLKPWLTASLKTGLDYYTDNRALMYGINSNAAFGKGGRVVNEELTYRHHDNYFNLSGDKKINKDLRIDYLVGVNYYYEISKDTRVQGDNLLIPNFSNISNATSISAQFTKDRIARYATYGNIDLAWKEMLFLTLTGRNDWSSTLPAANRSFFYPSTSVSWIFTELAALKNKSSILSFGKFRGSWAQVGHDAPLYATRTNLVSWATSDGFTTGILWPQNGVGAFGYNTSLGNPTLKPENTYTREVGMNLMFFKNRLSIDVTYYNITAKDLIVPASTPASIGANSAYFNSGRIESKGWEVVLGGSPIKNQTFGWNVMVNFTKNRSVVTKLASGLPELKFLNGFGAGTLQRPGYQVNQIYGNDWVRDAKNNIIIDDSGTPLTNPNYGYPGSGGNPGIADQTSIIGNPNPNWTMGLTNTFNFKNLEISFLFDIRNGSQMWNGTRSALNAFGKTKETEDRTRTSIMQGVKSSNGAANDIPALLGEYWYGTVNNTFSGIATPFIENSNWVRLRYITLGYTLPASLIKKTKFIQSAAISFTGRNLILSTPYKGIDPESSLTGNNSHAQGLEYFNTPGTKSYAVSLSLKF